MKFIEFPQQTIIMAKDQPQYSPIPMHIIASKSFPGRMEGTAVLELSDEDIADIVANRKIYYRRYFAPPYQPMFISTKDPFIEENKVHWPAEE